MKLVSYKRYVYINFKTYVFIFYSAALAKASVDRVEGPFVTVVPVAFADNPAGVELMFAECDFVQRVEKPNGTSVETQKCHLIGPFVEFPGTPPTKAFNTKDGPWCGSPTTSARRPARPCGPKV